MYKRKMSKNILDGYINNYDRYKIKHDNIFEWK